MPTIKHNFLSLTADDYGPHPFINNGILEAVKNGKVHSVGVLSNNYPEANYDCKTETEKLIDAIGDQNIGIGVHLSISSGAPITDSKMLYLENGKFQNMATFDFGKNCPHLKAVRLELKEQILRIKTILDENNIPIDHISCHHGLTGLFTPYHDQLKAVLDEIGLKTTIRNPLTISKYKKYKKHFKHSFMKKEGVDRALKMFDDNFFLLGPILDGISYKNLLAKGYEYYHVNCKVPRFLFDYFYKRGDEEALNHIFKRFPKKNSTNTGEIMIHLGKPTGNSSEDKLVLNGINSGYFKGRTTELDTLMNYNFDAQYGKYNIQGKRMGEFI